MTYLRLHSLAAAVCLVLAKHGFSETNLMQRVEGGQNVVGIKLGILNGTTFNVQYHDSGAGILEYHSRASVTGGLFFDLHLSRTSCFSVAVDIFDVVVNNDREKLLNLGLDFKKRISSPDAEFILRPAIGAGLGYMADINFLKASSFLTYKAYLEMLLRTEKPHSYLLDIGIIAGPVGGNSKLDVDFVPMVFLRAGIIY